MRNNNNDNLDNLSFCEEWFGRHTIIQQEWQNSVYTPGSGMVQVS
jgi:hypothetical protein